MYSYKRNNNIGSVTYTLGMRTKGNQPTGLYGIYIYIYKPCQKLKSQTTIALHLKIHIKEDLLGMPCTPSIEIGQTLIGSPLTLSFPVIGIKKNKGESQDSTNIQEKKG